MWGFFSSGVGYSVRYTKSSLRKVCFQELELWPKVQYLTLSHLKDSPENTLKGFFMSKISVYFKFNTRRPLTPLNVSLVFFFLFYLFFFIIIRLCHACLESQEKVFTRYPCRIIYLLTMDIHEPWMSIGVFLSGQISRQGYYHGYCMDSSTRDNNN